MATESKKPTPPTRQMIKELVAAVREELSASTEAKPAELNAYAKRRKKMCPDGFKREGGRCVKKSMAEKKTDKMYRKTHKSALKRAAKKWAAKYAERSRKAHQK